MTGETMAGLLLVSFYGEQEARRRIHSIIIRDILEDACHKSGTPATKNMLRDDIVATAEILTRIEDEFPRAERERIYRRIWRALDSYEREKLKRVRAEQIGANNR